MPDAFRDQRVTVRGGRQVVRIYGRGQLVKMHLRQPPGGRSTDPKDHPNEEVAIDATRDRATLLDLARNAGTHVGPYAERLMESPLPWTRMRHLCRLLGRVRRYGGPTPDRPCAQALALDVVEVTRIERRLERAVESRPGPLPPSASAAPAGSVLVLPGRFARAASEFAVRGTPPLPLRRGEDDDRT